VKVSLSSIAAAFISPATAYESRDLGVVGLSG